MRRSATRRADAAGATLAALATAFAGWTAAADPVRVEMNLDPAKPEELQAAVWNLAESLPDAPTLVALDLRVAGGEDGAELLRFLDAEGNPVEGCASGAGRLTGVARLDMDLPTETHILLSIELGDLAANPFVMLACAYDAERVGFATVLRGPFVASRLDIPTALDVLLVAVTPQVQVPDD